MLFNKIIHELLRPINQFRVFLGRFLETAKVVFLSRERLVFLNCRNQIKRGVLGKVLPFNWGDDLNALFLGKVFDKHLVSNPFFYRILKKNKNAKYEYSLIGSIIYESPVPVIVWGSGVMHPENFSADTDFSNLKFLAVRGPLTRKFVLEHKGICPEIYGDPALLLPLFFKKTISKKRLGVGILPGWWEHKELNFSMFFENVKKQEECRLIKVRNYKKWMNFVDEIVSSEFIVSSSLHGLIIAEAYKIPSVWVCFSEKKMNENEFFKYRDFYLSIGKDIQKPILVTPQTTIKELREYSKLWREGELNLKSLLSVAPFSLKTDVQL